MAYTKKTWQKGEIIRASDLNNMEAGIEAAGQGVYMPHLCVNVHGQGELLVLYYTPSESGEPIYDVDEIVNLLVNNPSKWFIEMVGLNQDCALQISSIEPDVETGWPIIRCTDGMIFKANSTNNRFELFGRQLLYKAEDEDLGKTVLALANNIGLPKVYDAAAIDTYLTGEGSMFPPPAEFVITDQYGNRTTIASYRYNDAVIECDNGDIYILDTIDDVEMYVLQRKKATPMLHSEVEIGPENTARVLHLVQGDGLFSETSPETIIDALLNGTTPWVIIDDTDAVAIKQIRNWYMVTDSTAIVCDGCEYTIMNDTFAYISDEQIIK